MDNKSEIFAMDTPIEGENIDDKLSMKEKINKTLRKNEQAKALLRSSAELISQADEDVEITKNSIIEDVNRLEDSKNLLNKTFTQGLIILDKLSYRYSKKVSPEPFEIFLGTTNDNVEVKNINSGGFSGLILALLVMVITAIGWIYLASIKVGVTLQPTIIPDEVSIDKMLTWIGGGMTGADGNPLFGLATIGISALVIGIIVYKIRVSLKESTNFKIANEIFEKSNIYVNQQKESKIEMEKIDIHIKDMLPLVENYKYLLDEQNAILRRVSHVEGVKEDYNDYHPSSIGNMKDTEKLMRKIEELLTTPITKDGKLNEFSKQALYEAKSVYEYYISKIYD